MANRIQLRRDTAANWTTNDPILAQGELGIETDTLKIKCGTGTDAWSALDYLVDTGDYLTTSDIGTSVQAHDADLDLISGVTGMGFLKRSEFAGNTSWFIDTANYVADFNGLATGLLLYNGYTEVVGTIPSGNSALTPNNGSIQTLALTANATPTQGTWDDGQSICIMVNNPSGFTITWTSIPVVWKTNNGNPPSLSTTSKTAIVLWKVESTVYGARVGNA